MFSAYYNSSRNIKIRDTGHFLDEALERTLVQRYANMSYVLGVTYDS